MELVIPTIGAIRTYLEPIFDNKALTALIESIEYEFRNGVEWKITKSFPAEMVNEVKEEGDGKYQRIRDNVSYQISISLGVIVVRKGVRGPKGNTLCPGWFGRLKEVARKNGARLTHRQCDKLFAAVTLHQRYLAQQ